MSEAEAVEDKQLSPEAQRLLDARKAAAEELKAIDGAERSLSDHFVRRLASARLYEASVMQRVLAGEPITSSEFKAASDLVEAARSNVPKNIEVKIQFVDGPVETCPKCGWVKGSPTAAPKLIEGKAEDVNTPSSPSLQNWNRSPTVTAMAMRRLLKPHLCPRLNRPSTIRDGLTIPLTGNTLAP